MLQPKRGTKARWTRDLKLDALSRMEVAGDVTAFAAEPGCRRELSINWRRKYQSGGAEALHASGRPLNADRLLGDVSAPSSPVACDAHRQIDE